MTPELQAIRQAIENQITTNHNGEITGAILNPILVGMITALVDSIGDIEQLDTVDKENTVRAINELNALIQDLEPIQKFTGTDDPNDNPPTGAKLGDLYFQIYGGAIVDVWQFIDIRWVSLDTSSFVRKSGENLVSTDFTLKNGDTELYFDGEYFNIKVLDLHLYTFREDGLTYSDGSGNEINLNIGGISGNNNGVLWNVRKDTDDIENSLLTLPQSSTEQRLAISVNNKFADEFGNIEIEPTDPNALKKNESNTVTEDFEITNIENGYGSSVALDGYQFKVISESVDDGFYGILGFTSEEGLIGNLHGGSFALNHSGVYGYLDLNNAESEWYVQKPYFDTEKSRVFLPQTGDTARRLAISVNNEFADENGNIELDYISESEKGQPLGVATLDADGQIPTDQLPTKAMTIEGDWDASTNTPFLEDSVGNDGMVYVCQVPGTVDFGSGEYEFKVGDWAVYGANGKWFRNRNSNEVTSVNAKRGDVVLNASDVGALASDDTRIADWDSAYTYSQVGHVPYTGANKNVNLGNNNIASLGHYLNNKFNPTSETRGYQTFVSMSENRYLTFKFTGKIYSANTRMQIDIAVRENITSAKAGIINISLRYGSDISAIVSDELFDEIVYYEDAEVGYITVKLRNVFANASINITNTSALSEIIRQNTLDLTDKTNVTPAQIEVIATQAWVASQIPTVNNATLQDATDNGNTTTNDVVLEKSMLIFEAAEEMSVTADSSNGWFWYGAGAKDDTPFYWNFRRGGNNEIVNSFYFQDNEHQIITFPLQESDASAVVAYQEWVNNKRKIYELDALVLNGVFNEELFAVCPTDLDISFITWDITWVDNDEHCSVKQEYFTKTDTPLRLTTVGGCLAITGDCFIQIDIPTGAKLVLNYA